MTTIKSELTSIRPGRSLYYKLVRVGGSNDNDVTEYKDSVRCNVVFVHGTCASLTQFQSVIDWLSDSSSMSMYCHLYDRIGCGKSPRPRQWKEYDSWEDVLDLEAIMKHVVSSSSPAIPTLIVAHSFGPSIVLRYIHHCRKEEKNIGIRACLFIGSVLPGGPVPMSNGGHPIFRLPVFVLQYLEPQLEKSFQQMAYHADTDMTELRSRIPPLQNDDMWVVKAIHRNSVWPTPQEIQSLQQQQQKRDYNADDERVIDVSVMHGRDDKLIPFECGQHMADVLQASNFKVVDKASHQVMEEQPQAVAEEILRLVTNNS